MSPSPIFPVDVRRAPSPTLSASPCGRSILICSLPATTDLSVDAMDVSGEHQLDVEHNIFKKRLASDGRPLGIEKGGTHQPPPPPWPERSTQPLTLGTTSLLELEAAVTPVPSPGQELEPAECGSCYGSEQVPTTTRHPALHPARARQVQGWCIVAAHLSRDAVLVPSTRSLASAATPVPRFGSPIARRAGLSRTRRASSRFALPRDSRPAASSHHTSVGLTCPFSLSFCVQCAREGFSENLEKQKGEGCQIYGHILVNKVRMPFFFDSRHELTSSTTARRR